MIPSDLKFSHYKSESPLVCFVGKKLKRDLQIDYGAIIQVIPAVPRHHFFKENENIEMK
jgi:tetrahydromethanopterin S-methyltransferase subunit G